MRVRTKESVLRPLWQSTGLMRGSVINPQGSECVRLLRTQEPRGRGISKSPMSSAQAELGYVLEKQMLTYRFLAVEEST
jgi:hypothetical protein